MLRVEDMPVSEDLRYFTFDKFLKEEYLTNTEGSIILFNLAIVDELIFMVAHSKLSEMTAFSRHASQFRGRIQSQVHLGRRAANIEAANISHQL